MPSNCTFRGKWHSGEMVFGGNDTQSTKEGAPIKVHQGRCRKSAQEAQRRCKEGAKKAQRRHKEGTKKVWRRRGELVRPRHCGL